MPIRTTLRRLVRKGVVRLGVLLEQAQDEVAQATLPLFAAPTRDVTIKLPREIKNPERITLGERVRLGPGSVLKASTSFPGSWLEHPEGRHREQSFDPRIVIGRGVTATSALQVVAFDRIDIEDDVMFAANVFICDGLHGYGSAEVPYKYQGIAPVAPIRIGAGSWIGQNVVVLPGVSIGRQCLIGANSVVTKDVPAQSIAVGVPAKVIRRWDEGAGDWRDLGVSA